MKSPLDVVQLRNDRVRIYGYSDEGSDGVVDSRYTFVKEVWAQFIPERADARIEGEAVTRERRATFGFHEQVSVSDNMVLTVNGEAYRIDGVPDPRTYAREMLRYASAVWVDRANLTLVET